MVEKALNKNYLAVFSPVSGFVRETGEFTVRIVHRLSTTGGLDYNQGFLKMLLRF